MPRCLLIFIVIFGFAFNLGAQPRQFRFEHITSEDGLPGDDIRTLFQDRKGFLWIATSYGLGKYDGYNVRTYRPNSNNAFGINHRATVAIHEDQQGELWIGTWGGGLNKLDPSTGRFFHYLSDPDDSESLGSNEIYEDTIFEDGAGRIWVATNAGGLDRLDPATRKVSRFRVESMESGALQAEPSLIHHPVLSTPHFILEDQDGTIWVATSGGGLHRFNNDEDTFTALVHNPNDNGTLSSNYIASIYEAPSEPGVLWIGTNDPADQRGWGLNRLDVSTGQIRRYLHIPEDPSSLKNNRIGRIFEDRQQRLWVTTCGSLDLFDRKTETFTHYVPDPAHPESEVNCLTEIMEDDQGMLWLPSSAFPVLTTTFDPPSSTFLFYPRDRSNPTALDVQSIRAMKVDRSGILWVGGNVGSLNKLDRWLHQFQLYRHNPDDPTSLGAEGVESLYEDRNGILWVGSWNVLNRFDRTSNSFERHFFDESIQVIDITGDDHGRLWIGTIEGGLLRFDTTTETVTSVQYLPEDPTATGRDRVCKVYVDHASKLWIGTEGAGLNQYDLTTKTFTNFRHVPGDSTSLPGDFVCSIFEDESGDFWVGAGPSSDRLLSRLDRIQGTFTSYPLPNSPLHFQPYQDRNRNLWIPTNEGLYLFDRRTGKATSTFTTAEGLPDDGVQGILSDEAGQLWLSTRNGLCRFDPKTKAFELYNKGLASNRFFKPSVHLQNGELVFGGADGIVLFHPEEITTNLKPPQAVIEGISYADYPVETEIRPVFLDSSIQLPPQVQNNLTFHYVGLHFHQSTRNRYTYRLDGFDNSWIEAGTIRQARYTNLSPGTYTFRLRASNSSGVWNEDEAVLQIKILPPWWRTIWAYLSYGLILVSSIIAINRLQHRHFIHRQEEEALHRYNVVLEKRVKERTDELSEANALLGNEISERIKKQDALEKSNRYLEETLTSLRETQAQLVQQERLAAVGQLAAGIAHDFNNILASIAIYTEIIIRAPDLPANLKKRLTTIAEQVDNAADLVQQILDFGRQAVMERRAIALMPFLEKTVALLKRTFPENIEIKLTCQPGDHAVCVDPARVQQAILNLAFNARDAMPDGGTIHVIISRSIFPESVRCITCGRILEGKWVQVAVNDTGGGISPDTLPHIFEPFFTTRAPAGSGLGLSQVYGIMKQHDGHINVETTLDQGSTFSLYFPSIEMEQPEADDPIHPISHQKHHATILVVEDDVTIRTALVDVLEMLEYHTLEAVNGADALEIFEQYGGKISLVLSDWVMPRLGGVALVEALKKLQDEVKVLMLTGHPLSESAKQSVSDSVVGWLHKPIRLEQLEEAVAKALRNER